MEDSISNEEERELVFKRFPKEKQEQIRQLVSYCTLMGLTGKDLVSIGGKLARIDSKSEALRLIDIAKSYEPSIVPVGKTVRARNLNEGARWVYTDSVGAKWEFYTSSMWQVDVKSRTTNKSKHFYLSNSLPPGVRRSCRGKAYMYNALIALHEGHIKLNF